jgi:transcriptional regulator with XRE-family HTH domain
MARRGDSQDLAATVTLLRALRGWSKKQLADASGVDKSQISRYELGRETPSARTLERLAAAAGLPSFLLEPMRSFIHRMREPTLGERPPGAGLTPATRPADETRGALGEALDRAVFQARTELQLHAERSSRTPAPPLDPELLWEQLKPFSGAERRFLVKNAREYQDPLLCERLCAESLQASATSAEQARELAELAVLVAEHLPEPRRLDLEGSLRQLGFRIADGGARPSHTPQKGRRS